MTRANNPPISPARAFVSPPAPLIPGPALLLAAYAEQMLNDEDNSDDVVVIALAGAAGVGKRSILQALHERVVRERQAFGPWQTFESSAGDRLVGFESRPTNVPRIHDDRGVRLLFRSTTGPVFSRSTYDELFACADAIVVTLGADPGGLGLGLARELVRDVRTRLEARTDIEVPLIFALNQRDVADAVPIEKLTRVVGIGKEPTLETVATSGQGIAELKELLEGAISHRIRANIHAVEAAEAAVSATMAPVARLADDLQELTSLAPPPKHLPALLAAEKAIEAQRWDAAIEHCRVLLAGGFARTEAWLMLLEALGHQPNASDEYTREREAAAREWLRRRPQELPAEDWATLLRHLQADERLPELREQVRRAKEKAENTGDFL